MTVAIRKGYPQRQHDVENKAVQEPRSRVKEHNAKRENDFIFESIWCDNLKLLLGIVNIITFLELLMTKHKVTEEDTDYQ